MNWNDIWTLNGIIDWETFTFSLDGAQLTNFSELPGRVTTLVTDPAADPVAAMLAFALLAVLLVLIAITLILIINRPKTVIRVESTDTTNAASKGVQNTDASKTTATAKTRPKVVLERRTGQTKDPMRVYFTIASFMIIFVLMWVSTGAVTRVDVVCASCHSSDLHVEQLAVSSHSDVSCVSCHEAGGLLGSITTAVPPRLAHVVVGTFSSENVPGYDSFAQTACADCHAGRLQSTSINSNGLLRISHAGIIEARFPCARCHQIDSDTGAMTIADGTMQNCATCHYSMDVGTLACATCHRNNSQYISSRQLDPEADFSRQLIPHSVYTGDTFCYRCHETGPCDSCHGGIRMPHPSNYVYSSHVTDTWDFGIDACDVCHTRGFCDNCHGFEMALTESEWASQGVGGRPVDP
ncbi:MAG: hypothetical protein FWC81_02440 [Coriobacteriia bacterium]|nr:hypothetical protein [Coriobacteriia bacterium]MCL2605676.1 hypothetical protein [Coriobacteriia bacterium]